MKIEIDKFIEQRADRHAGELLKSIALRPIDKSPSDARTYVRGFDFYPANEVRLILKQAILQFFVSRKRFPQHPLTCRSAGEKLFWLKFIVPLPLPTPADRLAVSDYIPAGLGVRVPKVVWISTRAVLPPDLRLPAGGYFFKSSHGWKTARRIRMSRPGAPGQELAMLGREWLARGPHNYGIGEWWYSTIEPAIFIEEEVENTRESTMEFSFFVLDGKVLFLLGASLPLNERGDAAVASTAVTAYDSYYNHLSDVTSANRPNPQIPKPPDFDAMCDAAAAIGSQFDFVRIDFFNPASGVIYLSEITLCHGAGNNFFTPEEFDTSVADGWDMGRYVLTG